MTIKSHKNDFWQSVIALIESSESKYNSRDYKGAIEDRRRAKAIIAQSNKLEIENTYENLLKESTLNNPKYDLIKDYKKKISDIKKSDLIDHLNRLSNAKYALGDYKGAIKALRRAERYY
tara:strand:- start:7 stop:366 length:360 start_codon:yes stop_codon:yes gene_type:complete